MLRSWLGSLASQVGSDRIDSATTTTASTIDAALGRSTGGAVMASRVRLGSPEHKATWEKLDIRESSSWSHEPFQDDGERMAEAMGDAWPCWRHRQLSSPWHPQAWSVRLFSARTTNSTAPPVARVLFESKSFVMELFRRDANIVESTRSIDRQPHVLGLIRRHCSKTEPSDSLFTNNARSTPTILLLNRAADLKHGDTSTTITTRRFESMRLPKAVASRSWVRRRSSPNSHTTINRNGGDVTLQAAYLLSPCSSSFSSSSRSANSQLPRRIVVSRFPCRS